MKKLLIILSFVLSAVIGAYALSADELLGKWESNTIKQDPTPEMPLATSIKLNIEYLADNKMAYKDEVSMVIDMGQGAAIDLFIKSEYKGTYTVEGDSITLVCDPETINLSFTEDDVRVRGVEDASQVEAIQTGMYQQFSQQVDQMKEMIGTEPNVIKNVMITGNKMMANLDDQIVTFKRKKK